MLQLKMPSCVVWHLAVLLCMVVFAELANARQSVSTKDKTLQKLFQNNVLWNSFIRSLRECAVLCSNDPKCSSFTFVKDSSQTYQLCRGYAGCAAVLKLGGFADIPAAVFYQISRRNPAGSPAPVTWAGTTCDSNSNCSQLQADSSCINDQCVCKPGFYYSISSATCVSECPPGNLVGSYTQYKGRALTARNDKIMDVGSVEECFDLCNGDPDCLSIDFKPSALRCLISYSVASGSTFKSYPLYDYYQRQCQ